MKKIIRNRLGSILITALFTIAFTMFSYYFILVPINLHSLGFWWFFILIAIYVAFIGWGVCFWRRALLKEDPMYLWRLDTIGEKFKVVKEAFFIPVFIGIFIAVWIVIIFVSSIPSWKMFRAEDYSNLITIQEGNFDSDIISASSSDIVSVDVKTAQRLGDRTIGNIPNASWYEVNDEYNLISINGEEYRISPLEYSGFFQAMRADGLPGYVLVNAKNQNAQYVKLEKPMLYSPDAYFKYDLSRHLRGQYPTYIFGKSFFEVDDNGNPFWITAVQTATIGLRDGYLENNAVVTNAVTGESIEYAIADLPKWIDHVHSVNYLMELLDNHYELANGYFNFSDTKKFKTSYSYKDSTKKNDKDGENNQKNEYTPFDGYNSILTNTGEIVFYTGITPTNKAETIIGFVLISPRTGVASYYEVSGSEESSAQSAAEGLVQNLKYSASFPTIINVDGVETYFMTLKDSAGLVQKYALCNVSQYSIVVEADTINEVISKYRNRLKLPNLESNSSDNKETVKTLEASGAVTQVETAQIDGYTFFYFTLDSKEDIIFMSSIENSNKQPLMLTENAKVTVKYSVSNDNEIGIVTAVEFK